MLAGTRDQTLEAIVKAHTHTRQTRLFYIAQAQLQAGDPQVASSTADLMQSDNLREQILKSIEQPSQ